MSKPGGGTLPEKPWWRSDLSRRQLRALCVMAALAILGGFFVPLVAPDVLPRRADSALRFAATMMVLRFLVQAPGAAPVRPGELDERELAERANILVFSYRAMLIGFGLIMMWVSASRAFDLWRPDGEQTVLLSGGLFWLLVLLPGSLLIWRSSDIEA